MLGATFALNGAGAANPFVDIVGNAHAADIDAIYNASITAGCTDSTHFCPGDTVKRDQMASFLARVAAVSSGTTKHFPLVNAKGPAQAYCALSSANPGSFENAPCQPFTRTVDSNGSVGIFPSIAVDVDGIPIMSYHDFGNDTLKVARCGTPSCIGTPELHTLDNAADVGGWSALTIGADALPIVSYWDGTNKDLKTAHCSTPSCAGPVTVTPLVTVGDVGLGSAIAIGTDALPIISYFDSTNSALKVVHCANAACSASNAITTIASVDPTSDDSSIAIGTDGFPIITYSDPLVGVGVAHCANVMCTSATTAFVGIGQFASVAIGQDGLPVIGVASSSALNVAHCTTLACSGAINTVVVDDDALPFGVSLVIGTDGLPLIAYEDATNEDLKWAHCVRVDCAGGTRLAVLDTEGAVGRWPSLAISPDGLPIVSYLDSTNEDLKVARPAVNS